jgi:hypothetical protein
VNVCELLKSAKQFDGKVVVVSGFIYAAGHSEGIAADGSPRIDPFHMTLIGCLTTSFLPSQTDAFACGPSRLLSRDDSGGMFPHPLGRVSHIEISKALSWKFVGEKTTQNLEERFLGQELLDLIYDPFAIGIAIRLDRYATSQSVKGGMPALHGFDRCFEIHGNGFVSQPVPRVERTRDLFVGAPTPQNLIPRFGGNTLKSASRVF